METLETPINRQSIRTVIWDIFKWIPELYTDSDIIHPDCLVILKTNFELFKNSAMAPVFEQTCLDQMHTLGSAAWIELTMLTNCIHLICNLIWSNPKNNPFKEWADRHFAAACNKDEVVIYQTDLVAAALTDELKQMEVWS